MRRCAQYVTKQARRVPCDRPSERYYCAEHGGLDTNSIGPHKPRQQLGDVPDSRGGWIVLPAPNKRGAS